VAVEQPSWDFDDLPIKCGVNETDIRTRRMTVAAERVQLLESLKAGGVLRTSTRPTLNLLRPPPPYAPCVCMSINPEAES
jgi:hypothetical protein